MDSKHRHQLEENILAKWLIAQYEGWIRPNSSWLGYAVLGVLVVVAFVIGTARVNSWNQASAWKQYYAALHSEQSEADLELIAGSTSGVVGIQARLALAQRQLTGGSAQVFTNKAESISTLEKALNSFQQIQKKTNDPLILQQAGFGLAQCWETLAAARVGDDLIKAEEEFQKVADSWGESFKGQQAKQRLVLLQQPATRKFFELAAAKKPESTGTSDFKVNIDPSDPFAPGNIDMSAFDQKAETTAEMSTEPPKPAATEPAEAEQESPMTPDSGQE